MTRMGRPPVSMGPSRAMRRSDLALALAAALFLAGLYALGLWAGGTEVNL